MQLCSIVLAVVALAGCAKSMPGEFNPTGDVSSASVDTQQVAPSPPRDQPTDLGQVMQQLESVRASVRRDVLSSNKFTERDDARLRAIFSGEALWFQRNVWQDAAVLGAPELNKNPNDGVFPVAEIVESNSDCVWFRSQPTDDYVVQPPQITIDIVLRRSAHDETINPTPWIIDEFLPVGELAVGEVCR